MRTYDAVIVGAGIVGASISFELGRQNFRVLLVDRQQPGQEASWAAAGMLSPAPDGPDAIPLVPLGRASLAMYPEFIATIEEFSGLKTGYRQEGALEVLFHGDAERELSTLVALDRGLGLAVEPLPVDEARELEPAISSEAQSAALFSAEASVDNRALTAAVLAAAAQQGVEIRAGLAATAVLHRKDRLEGVLAGGEKIRTGCVVVAAGCYASELEHAAAYAPTRPVRGQMVALRAADIRIKRVLRSARGYIVPRDDGRLIVGSTLENAGFEKKVTADGIRRILSAALDLAPELAHAAIVETWSGLRPDTPDHLPVLGPTDIEGLVMAAGHYRNGILLAPITAKLIREWVIEKRTSLSLDEFSPSRFHQAKQTAG